METTTLLLMRRELYVQENGEQADIPITVELDPEMGRIHSAANFIESIEGKAASIEQSPRGFDN